LARRKEELLEPDRCARMFRAMADPARLRIVQCLRSGSKHVSEIATLMDDDVVKVSHHLRILAQAGIVSHKKQGRYVHYQLLPSIFQADAGGKDGEHLDFGCCRVELPS
jgi:ArsR family transcriptional regulator, nickel/cobalt-responsive transcriptional repressor